MRYGAALLKKGMSGSNVRQWLRTSANYGGSIICLRGLPLQMNSDQAVKSFQAEHGLGVDGVVGNATKECLYKLVRFG